MSNHQFTIDILNDALFRAGEQTNGTSDFQGQALIYLNNVYFQICRGGSELTPSIKEDWAWLRKPLPGVLALHPPLTSGTASLTRGSATLTLSTAPEDTFGTDLDIETWFFKVDSLPEVYRISDFTLGATTATLDQVYLGPTASSLSYTLFKLDYDLAEDCMRLVAPMRLFQNSGWNSRDDYKVYACDLDTLEDQYPLAYVEKGIPDYFAPIGEITPGIKRVRFNRCGATDFNTLYRVEYEYLFRPEALTTDEDEEPLVPLQFRSVLSDYLLAYLLGIKNDNRAGAAAQAAQAGLLGMASENRYQTTTSTKHSFRMMPRMNGMVRRPGVLRTESGSIIG